MKKVIIASIMTIAYASSSLANGIEKDISNTSIYKTAKENDCNSFLLKADELEKEFEKKGKYSYDMINNCIVRIELNYKKYLTCEKLKGMK